MKSKLEKIADLIISIWFNWIEIRPERSKFQIQCECSEFKRSSTSGTLNPKFKTIKQLADRIERIDGQIQEEKRSKRGNDISGRAVAPPIA